MNNDNSGRPSAAPGPALSLYATSRSTTAAHVRRPSRAFPGRVVLAISALAVCLAGCTSLNQTLGTPLASGSTAPSLTSTPDGAANLAMNNASLQQNVRPVRLAPITGVPAGAADRIRQELERVALSKGIGLVVQDGAPVTYQLTGHLLMTRSGGRATITHVWDLSGANGQQLTRIAGEETADAGQAVAAGAAATAESQVTVQRGDTLSGIAKRHNVRVADLVAANNITGTLIRVGQTLRIPAGGAAGAAAPAAQDTWADVPPALIETVARKVIDGIAPVLANQRT